MNLSPERKPPVAEFVSAAFYFSFPVQHQQVLVLFWLGFGKARTNIGPVGLWIRILAYLILLGLS